MANTTDVAAMRKPPTDARGRNLDFSNLTAEEERLLRGDTRDVVCPEMDEFAAWWDAFQKARRGK